MSQVTFVTVNVPGDGNCFYHVVCKYMELKGLRVNHRVLRHAICDFLLEKSKTIARNLEKIDFPMTEHEIICMSRIHRHNGVFTDNELIQRVAMKIMDIPIRVYFGSGTDCWNPLRAKIKDSCNILCRDSHFQLLLVDE